jgi:REP element-mobilizing transposase RayT
MNEKTPKRKKNRLENYDYSSVGMYFITICTAQRINYFWKNSDTLFNSPDDVELSEYGMIVESAINNIAIIYPSVYVEQYVIMPDHIHLLLSICDDENGRPMAAPTISRIVNKFKGYITKCIGKSLWQKLFYDHIIRNKQDYDEHVKYICENPMRWYYKRFENIDD